MQALLDDIVTRVTPLLGHGKVADYIPALADVSPHQFGIAVHTVDGQIYQAGDAQTPFSIQSISKVLTLTRALSLCGDQLWQRVDREPSGQRFNSILQLEFDEGIPKNPFINAGALLIADLLQSRCASPQYSVLALIRKLAGNHSIKVNRHTAASEAEHGARSAAMAYLMKSYGNFHNDVQTVLNNYFNYCAVEMNCLELARTFSYLANEGRCAESGESILSARECKRMNALMATCGLYNAAGDFAYRVGLPAKSGVGGGIIAVIPRQLSICVWSPGLNERGNSLAGTAALEHFTDELGISIF